MEIISYRTVFDLERRVYRVDRLRLNPGGIPLRGVVYFTAIVAVALLVAKLPLLGAPAGAVPWYLRDIAAPAAGAALLTMIRVEGRPFHLAARALVRYGTCPRHLSGVRPRSAPGQRWCLGELLILPDGSDARLRRLRYTGSGAVLVSAAHIRSDYDAGGMYRLLGRPQMTLCGLTGRRPPARGQVLALVAGARLEVRVRTRRERDARLPAVWRRIRERS
jgi:hypothetical protein